MHQAPDGLSAFAQAIPSTQSAPIHTLIFGTWNMSQSERHFADVIKSFEISKEIM